MKKNIWAISLLSGIVFFYVYWVLRDFYGPGIVFEEFTEAIFTLKLFKGIVPLSYFSIAGLPLFTTNSYSGALQTYLLIPFFKIFGMNLTAVRSFGLVSGILIIIFTYRFMSDYAGRPAGLLTAAFLAVEPVFIVFTRTLTFSDGILNLIMVLSIYYGYRYLVCSKNHLLYITAFLIGLGLWVKIVFIWYIVGVAAVILMYGLYRRFKLRQLALGSMFFFAGSLPLWYLNITKGFPTFRLMFNSLFGRVVWAGDNITDNLNILQNIGLRYRQFFRMYGGQDMGSLASNWLYIHTVYREIFIAAVLILLVYALLSRGRMQKKVGAVLIIFVVIFTGLCFTVSTFRTQHLFFMVPFPQMILALAVVILYRMFSSFSINRYLSMILPAALFAAIVIPQYRLVRHINGGNAVPQQIYTSPVALKVAGFLEQKGIDEVAILNRREFIADNIYFLSGGDIKFHYIDSAEDFKSMGKEFFLLEYPVAVHFDDKEHFRFFNDQLSRRQHRRETMKEFRDKNDRLIYRLEKIEITG